ncbi:hypothetical protein SAMN05421595_3085 [Austwickia chelonae]|uniref:AMIN-like domain-containing (lipo)protein n=1 Tax=Austwickia chelonae TaxID=100225 RepID=UPI00032167AE|nr:hypothetical protein [Austwickia chelonae]SEW43770.1 hypothetical protein SAMN05421595_3085 [Austwickia chelonae]
MSTRFDTHQVSTNTGTPRTLRRPAATRLKRALAVACLPLVVASCGGQEKMANTASTSSMTSSSSASSTSPSLPTVGTSTSSTQKCSFDGALTTPGDTALSKLTVTGVRTGKQDCFDRLVIDLSGDASKKPGYQVRYVPRVLQDGSGKPVTLRGGAFLTVGVGAASYDASAQPTFIPADKNELSDVTGYAAFKQVAWAGSFEGMTTIGIGVREELPFNVQVMDEGGKVRLVIDVAHQRFS